VIEFLFESLRKISSAEARKQVASNPTARRYLHPVGIRVARRLFQAMSFTRLLVGYVSIQLLVSGGKVLNDWYCIEYGTIIQVPDFLTYNPRSSELLLALNSTLVASQAALIGILAIAVALVTFLGAYHNVRVIIRAYFQDSLVEPIVKSALALILVLSVQVVWPIEFLVSSNSIADQVAIGPLILSALHIVWGGWNILFTAYFITSSLDFAEPTSRLARIETYYASDVFHRILEKQIIYERYRQIGPKLLDYNSRDEPKIYVWPSVEGDILVSTSNKRPKTLVDVWQVPLRLAFRMWFARLPPPSKASADWMHDPERCIYAQIDIGSTVDSLSPIYRGVGLPRFNFWERQLLRWSFRLRKI